MIQQKSNKADGREKRSDALLRTKGQTGSARRVCSVGAAAAKLIPEGKDDENMMDTISKERGDLKYHPLIPTPLGRCAHDEGATLHDEKWLSRSRVRPMS